MGNTIADVCRMPAHAAIYTNAHNPFIVPSCARLSNSSEFLNVGSLQDLAVESWKKRGAGEVSQVKL